MSKTNHSWLPIRGASKAAQCVNCDVKRFTVSGLGLLYSVGWGSFSLERAPCPTRLNPDKPSDREIVDRIMAEIASLRDQFPDTVPSANREGIHFAISRIVRAIGGQPHE